MHTDRQFLEEVFPAELESIRRRRASLGLGHDRISEEPSTENGLVGLAFSGGGIRSATFGLGVLQILEERGLLNRIDYHSTVSGGGYIGSCLGSLAASLDTSQKARPHLLARSGVGEPLAVTHLRNGSKYLTPGGLLDKVRLPTLILRGLLLNLFLFLPYVLLAVLVTELLYEFGPPLDLVTKYFLPGVIAGYLVLVVVFPFVTSLFRHRFSWSRRDTYERALAGLVVLLVATVVLIAFAHLIRYAVEEPWDGAKLLLSQGRFLERFGLHDYWLWLAPALALLAALTLVKISSGAASWLGRIGITILGLCGPALLFAIYLFLCLWQIDSPFIPEDLRPELDRMAESPTSVHEGSELLRSAFENREFELPETFRVSITTAHESEIHAGADGRAWLIETDTVDGDGDPVAYTIASLGDGRLILEEARHTLFHFEEDLLFFVLFLVLVGFNFLFLDVNIASMHGFYRDRLTRTFLLRFIQDGTTVEPNDGQTLSGLADRAPYHLINGALNLQGSKDTSLRGRKAELFLFSKRFIGSDRTGYVPTSSMEKIDPHINLGTAMAISGAAAAPNMGSVTLGPLVFLMTLFNLRLGYWVPNPKKFAHATLAGNFLLRNPGPGYLLREAMGRVDDNAWHVNISDGGHIENSAVFPLLKRRCSVILAIDSSADPFYGFNDFVRLQHLAAVDLGVEITIELDEITPSDGVSSGHFAFGRILYPDGQQGVFIYVKPALSGDEAQYVHHYKQSHPSFPHESTADQFFDEVQFEAYRALGSHSMSAVLKRLPHVTGRLDDPKWVAELFEI
ncbi:MAG: patatin-like phospholipase family protein, partial [Rhodothermales bacterium]|nr:patatin-like phospholipase family protein [Rhodothermales bacterium]